MDFRRMLDEMIFNDKLHKQKGLFPNDHPVTGNINVIAIWNRMTRIDEYYQTQLELDK